MKKATKAAIKRLKATDSPLARILVDRIEIANNIADYEDEGLYALSADDYRFGSYTPDGRLFIRVQNSFERAVFMGAASKYGCRLIETTLTHGNNQVIISDINKLEKTMTTGK